MSEQASQPANEELGRVLRLDDGSKWRRLLTRAAVALGVGVLLVGGYLYSARTSNDAPRYVTEPVVRGELIVTVAATGNLQPTNKVDVGSELSLSLIHI